LRSIRHAESIEGSSRDDSGFRLGSRPGCESQAVRSTRNIRNGAEGRITESSRFLSPTVGRQLRGPPVDNVATTRSRGDSPVNHTDLVPGLASVTPVPRPQLMSCRHMAHAKRSSGVRFVDRQVIGLFAPTRDSRSARPVSAEARNTSDAARNTAIRIIAMLPMGYGGSVAIACTLEQANSETLSSVVWFPTEPA
jgi:hypothetical protein